MYVIAIKIDNELRFLCCPNTMMIGMGGSHNYWGREYVAETFDTIEAAKQEWDKSRRYLLRDVNEEDMSTVCIMERKYEFVTELQDSNDRG